MRSTAPTAGCAAGWKPVNCPMCWRAMSTEPLPPACGPGAPTTAAQLAKRVPPACWLRLSAGQGAKGRRWYAWSRLPLSTAGAPTGWGRWLLLRRSLRTGELATTWAPARPACRWSPWSGSPGPAGGWRRRLQAGKGLCGLDSHQVRRWCSWYRWVTLSMLAYAFLVVAAVSEPARHPPPLGLIPLTCNEIQHLVAALVAVPVADPGHRLRWSWWRRRRQARARACHYRRQAAQQP